MQTLWPRTIDDPIAFFTFWLAIFSFCLVAVAVFQIWLLIRAERVAVQTAVAAKQSADVARDAVALTQVQMRAYVAVSGGSVDNFGSAEPVLARVEIKNTGQTPAYKVVARTVITTRPFPVKEALPNPQVPEAHMTLGPNAEFTLRVETARALTDEETAKIRRGEMAIYVFGEIIYSDAFGKPRTTQFRLYYGGDKESMQSGALHPYQEGNDAN